MVDAEEIEYLLNRYFWNIDTEELFSDEDYVIGADGSVQITNVDVGNQRPAPGGVLPLKFGTVDGGLSIASMKLKTLLNSPKTVNGKFDCSRNLLTSLAHSPDFVVDFDCSYNQLTSLKGCPKVPGELVCNHNQLKTLESVPEAGRVWATNNPFEHFRDTPSHIGTVSIFWYPNLPLLGLLTVGRIELFEPETYKSMQKLEQIMNRYSGQGRAGAFDCRQELKKAGFEGNAKW